jgi:hypothetical protein
MVPMISSLVAPLFNALFICDTVQASQRWEATTARAINTFVLAVLQIPNISQLEKIKKLSTLYRVISATPYLHHNTLKFRPQLSSQ